MLMLYIVFGLLRELRASCYESIGDIQSAITDLRPAIRSVPDNTGGYLHLAQLYYKHGDPDDSLTTIRECLKLDPDHKECMALYKNVKKLAGQVKSMQELYNAGKHAECVEKGNQALFKEKALKMVGLIKTKQCQCASKVSLCILQ